MTNKLNDKKVTGATPISLNQDESEKLKEENEKCKEENEKCKEEINKQLTKVIEFNNDKIKQEYANVIAEEQKKDEEYDLFLLIILLFFK